MGIYDFVEYQCVNCGNQENAQTKVIGPCNFERYQLGSDVGGDNWEMVLKNPCFECKTYHTIMVKEGRIEDISVAKEGEEKESYFGSMVRFGEDEDYLSHL